jgi:hypothetical protein
LSRTIFSFTKYKFNSLHISKTLFKRYAILALALWRLSEASLSKEVMTLLSIFLINSIPSPTILDQCLDRDGCSKIQSFQSSFPMEMILVPVEG